MSAADTPHVCKAATELKVQFGLPVKDTLPILRDLAKREHEIAQRMTRLDKVKADSHFPLSRS